MVSAFIIVSALIAIVAIALGAAYTTGALDPVIEKIAVLLFKAKAEAEAKKLQAQGLKEGEDFVKGKLVLTFVFALLGRPFGLSFSRSHMLLTSLESAIDAALTMAYRELC